MFQNWYLTMIISLYLLLYILSFPGIQLLTILICPGYQLWTIWICPEIQLLTIQIFSGIQLWTTLILIILPTIQVYPTIRSTIWYGIWLLTVLIYPGKQLLTTKICPGVQLLIIIIWYCVYLINKLTQSLVWEGGSFKLESDKSNKQSELLISQILFLIRRQKL